MLNIAPKQDSFKAIYFEPEFSGDMVKPESIMKFVSEVGIGMFTLDCRAGFPQNTKIIFEYGFVQRKVKVGEYLVLKNNEFAGIFDKETLEEMYDIL